MTPAVVALKQARIHFSIHEYQHDPKATSFGEEAAEKLGVDPAAIFKTLMIQGENKSLAVAIVPVMRSLDLKAAASALKMKKVQMADKQLVARTSGYIIGGVSPIGQKKLLPTILDASANGHEKIYVSGGKRGFDIALAAVDLLKICNGQVANIAKD